MQPPAVASPSIFATPTTESSAVASVAKWVPAWVPGWTINLFAVAVVLLGAWLLSRGLVAVFGRRIAKRFRRPSLTRTFLRGIRAVVYLMAFFTILSIYGFSLGDIALQVTVISAVVAVVLAPIVSSVISGVFLLADQPYEIGDMVELADTNQRGFVEDITLRYTKIFTLDNTFLVIPNGAIRDRDVVNYSAEDPRTRQSIDIVVTYEGDLDVARERFERAARGVDGVIGGGPDIRVGAARYPASPTCYINEFGDHGVRLTLRFWVTEPYKLLAIRSRVQTAMRDALGEIEADIAYPHSHLVFDETSGELPVRQDGQSERRPEAESVRSNTNREPAADSSPD